MDEMNAEFVLDVKVPVSRLRGQLKDLERGLVAVNAADLRELLNYHDREDERMLGLLRVMMEPVEEDHAHEGCCGE